MDKVEEKKIPEDVEFMCSKNQYGYDKRQLVIDYENKTYKVGQFKIASKGDIYTDKQISQKIDDLKEKGFKEVKTEGAVHTVDKEVTDLEEVTIGTETSETKVKDKKSFEEYKELYEGQIDEKCIEDYGTSEDKKLWEDTAKEMYLEYENFIPKEDVKPEGDIMDKVEESVEMTRGLTYYETLKDKIKKGLNVEEVEEICYGVKDEDLLEQLATEIQSTDVFDYNQNPTDELNSFKNSLINVIDDYVEELNELDESKKVTESNTGKNLLDEIIYWIDEHVVADDYENVLDYLGIGSEEYEDTSKIPEELIDNTIQLGLNWIEEHIDPEDRKAAYTYLLGMNAETLRKYGFDEEDIKKLTESTSVSDYTLNQIKKLLDSEDTGFKLKISGDNTDVATNYLDLSKEDVDKIYKALGGK